MIMHHPGDELLLDYAAGTLDEGTALAVATHAAMCAPCLQQLAMLDAAGGAMLERVRAEPVPESLLEQTLTMLDASEPASVSRPPFDAATVELIPEPLRRYLGRSLSELSWRRVGGFLAAVEEVRLPVASRKVKVALMRMKAGSVTPRHSHHGNEYALVLAGGLCDGGDQYRPGDFMAKTYSDTHQPVIDNDGDCLCLVVLDAPLRLSGPIGRLINPFMRI